MALVHQIKGRCLLQHPFEDLPWLKPPVLMLGATGESPVCWDRFPLFLFPEIVATENDQCRGFLPLCE
jgi:hypothetical protein